MSDLPMLGGNGPLSKIEQKAVKEIDEWSAAAAKIDLSGDFEIHNGGCGCCGSPYIKVEGGYLDNTPIHITRQGDELDISVEITKAVGDEDVTRRITLATFKVAP